MLVSPQDLTHHDRSYLSYRFSSGEEAAQGALKAFQVTSPKRLASEPTMVCHVPITSWRRMG